VIHAGKAQGNEMVVARLWTVMITKFWGSGILYSITEL